MSNNKIRTTRYMIDLKDCHCNQQQDLVKLVFGVVAGDSVWCN